MIRSEPLDGFLQTSILLYSASLSNYVGQINSILAVLPESHFLFCTKVNVTCLGREARNITIPSVYRSG